jgi:tetratricopeptide (TPR) repeat protein
MFHNGLNDSPFKNRGRIMAPGRNFLETLIKPLRGGCFQFAPLDTPRCARHSGRTGNISNHSFGLNQRFLLALAGIFAVIVTGCATFSDYGRLEKSARENYQRGNYDQAMFSVVRSLQIKPDYKDSQALVQDTFPRAIEKHLVSIEEAKNGNAKFRWDRVVSEYDALIKVNQAARSLPVLIDEESKVAITFNVQDYTLGLSEAKTNAAEEHYQEGRRLFGKAGIMIRDQASKEFSSANGFVPQYKDASTLAAEGYYQEGLLLSKNDTVDIQKQAAKAFTAAQQFVPGYKDAAVLYDRARKAGVKRIAIIPFEDKSGKGSRYGAVADAIVDGIVSEVMNDSSATEFLEIISRDQLDRVMQEQRLGTTGLIDQNTAVQLGKLLGVHEIVTGKITQIAVSPEQTTTRNAREKVTVICNRTYERDGKTKCLDDDVFANATIYDRKAGVTIAGTYSVIDVKTAALKQSKTLDGKYAFSTRWATFSGDERALSADTKRLASVSEEHAPVVEEMVNSAMKDLTYQLSKTFKDYAR